MSKKDINPEIAAEAREALLNARRQAEEAKLAHGHSIALSVQKGQEIATKAFGADILIQDLGRAVINGISESLSVTSTGLVVSDGYLPTEQDVTQVVSGACGIKEQTAKFNTTLSWVLGDAALLAERFDGGVDRVVVQAISERGAAKHTVLQAIRVCRAFPYGDRMAGVSFSHHLEILNYREGIPDKEALAEILGELQEGGLEGDPMSCADLRERLNAISEGNRKKPKAETFTKCPKCGYSHEPEVSVD